MLSQILLLCWEEWLVVEYKVFKIQVHVGMVRDCIISTYSSTMRKSRVLVSKNLSRQKNLFCHFCASNAVCKTEPPSRFYHDHFGNENKTPQSFTAFLFLPHLCDISAKQHVLDWSQSLCCGRSNRIIFFQASRRLCQQETKHGSERLDSDRIG